MVHIILAHLDVEPMQMILKRYVILKIKERGVLILY